MLAELLLPNTQLLHIQEIQIVTASLVAVNVSTSTETGRCPGCDTEAHRVHSRRVRTLQDLSCAGREMRYYWQIRRFFCDNHTCSRLTFTEQYSEITNRYARRTKRLQDQQIQLSYELGGKAGKRLAEIFHVPISGDQLLRMLVTAPETVAQTPRVCGVDDWAMRKRHTYGTILVDLEKHSVIDLLPDREPETLIAWLQGHPGIEIISRDRGQEYIDGITRGAPHAIQVADRFHLLSNLLDVMERVFKRSPNEIRQAEKQCVRTEETEGTQTAPEIFGESPTGEIVQPQTYTQARFAAVKALQQQGLKRRQIARQLGIDRRTVGKYFQLDEPPKRSKQMSYPSKASPYLDYLQQRLDEGCYDLKMLLNEIQERGYSGSYSSLWRAVHGRLGVGKLRKSAPPVRKAITFSPRQAAWICIRPETELKEVQQRFRATISAGSPEIAKAIQLAQDFRVMIEQKQSQNLDAWLTQSEKGDVAEFKRFAESLRSDYAAVKAALTHSWSNGQTEGQVNRLKLIKRQMYGRASFNLLRKRMLGPPINA